jgi:hypothetical protein
MNRIEQLKQQATHEVLGVKTVDAYILAELIINDCTQWINDNVGMVDEEARLDLMKHFGFE